MRRVRVRAVIPHNGKYLFVRHAGKSPWVLPGGHLEEGEALVDGIVREIIEELGSTPSIGKILYVQQLFISGDESLEFFFEVLNGQDFINIDLGSTTHGHFELAEAAFIDPASVTVLPEFLANLDNDMKTADFPKLFVHRQTGDYNK